MSLRQELNQSIKPGDDFFGYVNSKWLQANPIPADKSSWGAMNVLTNQNITRLHKLLAAVRNPSRSPGTTLVRTFFRSGMDRATITATTAQFVRRHRDDITKLSNSNDLQKMLAGWHAQGLPLIWGLSIGPDDKNSSRYVLQFYQDGLGLPDRDYYFDKGEQLETVRSAYKAFLSQIFQLLQMDNPQKRADTVYRLESKLAKASATATERRDAEKMYNPYKVKALAGQFGGWDWRSYFDQLGLNKIDDVIISQPAFIIAAIKLLNDQSIEAWQSYIIVHTLLPLLTKLAPPYENLHFNFYGRILRGLETPEPRYRRIIRLCEEILPEPTGQLFVEAHFDESAKQAVSELVDRLKVAFRARIMALDWMGDTTKRRAREKLDTFLPLLGYPDRWKSYRGLKLGANYAENFLAILNYEWRREVTRINSKVDRKEWLMSPALVNAYYWANTNCITFPAGILQPPFFNAQGDFAANYGSIGAVIGHEMSHGFDDQGSLFDKVGNLNTWWSQSDRRKFKARAKRLELQYGQYQIDGRHVNGALTLGENIADLGGLAVAYDAFLSRLTIGGEGVKLNGFSPAQRFFLAYTRSWRAMVRPELQTMLLISDPHSPYQFRVNGIIRNSEAFYEAFDCRPGDRLYLAPADRVKIW